MGATQTRDMQSMDNSDFRGQQPFDNDKRRTKKQRRREELMEEARHTPPSPSELHALQVNAKLDKAMRRAEIKFNDFLAESNTTLAMIENQTTPNRQNGVLVRDIMIGLDKWNNKTQFWQRLDPKKRIILQRQEQQLRDEAVKVTFSNKDR